MDTSTGEDPRPSVTGGTDARYACPVPRFTDVDIFLAVAERGSFRAEADALEVTRSTVSRGVQRLEEHLGTTLLLRDSQSLRLTDAGRLYQERAKRAAQALTEGERAVAGLAERVGGVLRVSAAPALGQTVVGRAVAELLAMHPGLRVDLQITDRLVDPVSEAVDVAVRAGERREGAELRGRLLARVEIIAAATPEVARQLEAESDLTTAVPSVVFTPHAELFEEGSAPRRFVPRLAVDDLLTVRRALVEGAGVGVVPSFLLASDLVAGRLVRVLPGWDLPTAAYWAVYSASGRPGPNIRAFVDHLAARLADLVSEVAADGVLG